MRRKSQTTCRRNRRSGFVNSFFTRFSQSLASCPKLGFEKLEPRLLLDGESLVDVVLFDAVDSDRDRYHRSLQVQATVSSPGTGSVYFEVWEDGLLWNDRPLQRSPTFTVSGTGTESVAINSDIHDLPHNVYDFMVKLYESDGTLIETWNAWDDLDMYRIGMEKSAADHNHWGIMVYMMGDNDLSDLVDIKIDRMQDAMDYEGVGLVVLADYEGDSGTKIGRIVPQDGFYGTSFEEIPEQDMGLQASLESFITKATHMAPADRYELIIFDHGGGLLGVGTGSAEGKLTPAEIRQAVSASGVNLDLISLDACLMGMTEVAYELRGSASYFTGSEATQFDHLWFETAFPYTSMLEALEQDITMSPRELASTIATNYGTWPLMDSTYSAIDLDYMYALGEALDILVASAAATSNPAQWAEMRRIVSSSAVTQYGHDGDYSGEPYNNYRDLGQFLDELASGPLPAEVKNTAASARALLNSAVVANTTAYIDGEGLSIYLPDEHDFVDGSFTSSEFQLLAETQWLSFIEALVGEPEIMVLGNNLEIEHNSGVPTPEDGTDFGQVSIIGESVTRTFTIKNDRAAGAGLLQLTGDPRVEVFGPAASDFSVVVQPESAVSDNYGTTTFQIRFDPSAEGDRYVGVRISNDDPDEGQYQITLKGTGTVPDEATVDVAGLVFDGQDDFAVSSPTTALNTLPLTIEAWVRPQLRTDGTSFPNNVVSNDRPGHHGHGFGMNVWNGGSELTVELQNGWRRFTNLDLQPDRWYHVATVYTPGNVKTYLDGELIDNYSFYQSSLDGVNRIRIGKHNDDAGYGTRRFFKGAMGEIGVWNVARDQGAIQTDMGQSLTGDEDGLVAYWRFNEGSGGTVHDETSNDVDVTLGDSSFSQPLWIAEGPELSLAAGESIVVPVFVSSPGGYTDSATLEARNVPGGISVTVDPETSATPYTGSVVISASEQYIPDYHTISFMVTGDYSDTEFEVQLVPPPTAQDMIEQGINWLINRQLPNGSWVNDAANTSMAVLAMLNAGYSELDPVVASGMDYVLSQIRADGSVGPEPHRYTYRTSIAILPLAATHNSDYHDEIARMRTWLINSQWDESSFYGSVPTGHWYYGGSGYGNHSRPDLSNTQWALMGLKAADRELGLHAGDTYGKAVNFFLPRCQRTDGGSGYIPGWASIHTMTAASVWSYNLSGVTTGDPRVDGGLQWLEDHYSVTNNDGWGYWSEYYYKVTFAKSLVMSHKTKLGEYDWFADLSTALMQEQLPGGNWPDTGMGGAEMSTAWALLALQTRTLPPDVDVTMWMNLQSHADLHVYDPQGRHLGIDYDTATLEQEIPDATLKYYDDVNGDGVYQPEEERVPSDYLGVPTTWDQVAMLPTLAAGSYRTELVGTSDGPFELTIEGQQDGTTVTSNTLSDDIVEGERLATSTTVTAMEGAITLLYEPLAALPTLDVEPRDVYLLVEPDTLQEIVLEVSEIGGQTDLHSVSFFSTDLVGPWGTIAGSSVTFNPNDFDVPAGEIQMVSAFVPIPAGFESEISGRFIVQSADGGARSIDVTLHSNRPPLADANGPYEVDENSVITFDASNSSDPDEDPLNYRWDFDTDGKWDTPWSSYSTATYVWGDDWSGTATVEVTDGTESSTATAAVTVNNIAPTLTLEMAGAIAFGDGVAFLGRVGVDQSHGASATDPGSDALTFAWDLEVTTVSNSYSVSSALDPDGPDPAGSQNVAPRDVFDTAGVTFADPGVYTIVVTVTDDDGGSDSVEFTKLVTGDMTKARTQGFWRHQFAGKNKQHIQDEALMAYLEIVEFASRVFSDDLVPLTSLEDAGAIFQPGGPDVGDPHISNMKGKATQQTLAAWLNFASGAILWDETVQTRQVSDPEDPFWEAITEIEDILLDFDGDEDHKDYVLANDIAAAINETDA